MSLEVDSQSYIYEELTAALQDEKESTRPTLKELMKAKRAELSALRQGRGVAQPPNSPRDATAARHTTSIPFKHNPLHDLESVLWVVIWLFVCSEFVKPDVDPEIPDDVWAQIREDQGGFAKRLFREDGFRHKAMTTSTTLLGGFDTALPQLHRPAQDLDAARDALIKQFVAVHNKRKQTGEQVSFDDIIGSGIHAIMFKHFAEISVNLLRGGDSVKINTSEWSKQRNAMRDAALKPENNSAAPTGTRRASDNMEDGATTSNKRYKQREGQSASSAQALPLPGLVPSHNSRVLRRRL